MAFMNHVLYKKKNKPLKIDCEDTVYDNLLNNIFTKRERSVLRE